MTDTTDRTVSSRRTGLFGFIARDGFSTPERAKTYRKPENPRAVRVYFSGGSTQYAVSTNGGIQFT